MEILRRKSEAEEKGEEFTKTPWFQFWDVKFISQKDQSRNNLQKDDPTEERI